MGGGERANLETKKKGEKPNQGSRGRRRRPGRQCSSTSAPWTGASGTWPGPQWPCPAGLTGACGKIWPAHGLPSIARGMDHRHTGCTARSQAHNCSSGTRLLTTPRTAPMLPPPLPLLASRAASRAQCSLSAADTRHLVGEKYQKIQTHDVPASRSDKPGGSSKGMRSLGHRPLNLAGSCRISGWHSFRFTFPFFIAPTRGCRLCRRCGCRAAAWAAGRAWTQTAAGRSRTP
jgi:hypothetical protein